MSTKTLLTVGLAALVVYAVLKKKSRPNTRDGGASIISTSGGASNGMILPAAWAAQRDTELYGYGSGS